MILSHKSVLLQTQKIHTYKRSVAPVRFLRSLYLHSESVRLGELWEYDLLVAILFTITLLLLYLLQKKKTHQLGANVSCYFTDSDIKSNIPKLKGP